MPKKPAKSRLRPGVKIRETADGPTYHTVVNLGKDPATGKRKQSRVTADSPEKLDELIVETRRAWASGTLGALDRTTTLREFIPEWLRSVESSVVGGTIRTWASRCRVWIVPVLGNRRLCDLNPADIERLMISITDAGRSSSHAHAIHSTIRTALNHAVRWQLIDRNPCSAVRAPRMAHPEMKTWSALEASRAIAESAFDGLLGPLFRLALTTGMRSGELLGLRWKDVDLERGSIAVLQSLTRGKSGGLELKQPKTQRSRRSIALSANDVVALKAHRKIQLTMRMGASEWTDNDLVFPNAKGGPTHPNSLTRHFRALIERGQLPVIRFHDLRHTAATLMLSAGEHPKVVSERLGHSSIAITMDRYSHVSIDLQREAAERIDSILKLRDVGA